MDGEVVAAYEKYLVTRGISLCAGGDVRLAITCDGETGYGFNAHPSQLRFQAFLLEYAKDTPGAEIDYIHGEDELRALAQRGGVGFCCGGSTSPELFPTIREKGVLPRKAFSMGEARQRYYLEARALSN